MKDHHFKTFTLTPLFSCGGNDARPTAVLIKVSETGELTQDDSNSSFSLDDWDVWQNPLRPRLQIVFQKV